MCGIIYIYKHFKKIACIFTMILLGGIFVGNYFYIVSKTDLALLTQLNQEFQSNLLTNNTPNGWMRCSENDTVTIDNNFIITQGNSPLHRTIIVKTADVCVGKTQKVAFSVYNIFFIIAASGFVVLLMILVHYVIFMSVLSQLWKRFMLINQYVEEYSTINEEKIEYMSHTTNIILCLRTIPKFSNQLNVEYASVFYSIQKHVNNLFLQTKIPTDYITELQKFILAIQ